VAGGQERVLKRRIRSVQSTKKITRAMELIAASRIVKAQARVEAARPYSEKITEVIHHLSGGGAGAVSPLLAPRAEVRRVAFVVVTADRGLCGAYNTSVIRRAERSLKAEQEQGREYALVLIGRKAESYFRFRRYDVEAAFHGMSDTPTYEDARRVAGTVAEAFESGTVDRVQLVYTKFISAGSQQVVESTLMPLDAAALGLADQPVSEGPASEADDGIAAAYAFEPGAGEILDRLLPRYVEARIFAAQLDAAASEHAARQRAMKAATDNADELITKLTRVMNRARQDAITTEIMEIVGGAEALRKGTALVASDLLADTIENRRADLFRARDAAR
jgi:F-type H+-transporting ATPase subunit gamma